MGTEVINFLLSCCRLSWVGERAQQVKVPATKPETCRHCGWKEETSCPECPLTSTHHHGVQPSTSHKKVGFLHGIFCICMRAGTLPPLCVLRTPRVCAGHRHLGFDSAQSTLSVMERARNCLEAPGAECGESIHHPNETTSNGLASVPATLGEWHLHLEKCSRC